MEQETATTFLNRVCNTATPQDERKSIPTLCKVRVQNKDSESLKMQYSSEHRACSVGDNFSNKERVTNVSEVQVEQVLDNRWLSNSYVGEEPIVHMFCDDNIDLWEPINSHNWNETWKSNSSFVSDPSEEEEFKELFDETLCRIKKEWTNVEKILFISRFVRVNVPLRFDALGVLDDMLPYYLQCYCRTERLGDFEFYDQNNCKLYSARQEAVIIEECIDSLNNDKLRELLMKQMSSLDADLTISERSSSEFIRPYMLYMFGRLTRTRFVTWDDYLDNEDDEPRFTRTFMCEAVAQRRYVRSRYSVLFPAETREWLVRQSIHVNSTAERFLDVDEEGASCGTGTSSSESYFTILSKHQKRKMRRQKILDVKTAPGRRKELLEKALASFYEGSHWESYGPPRNQTTQLVFKFFVPQGAKVADPRFTVDDLCERLARLGFSGFRARVLSEWARMQGRSFKSRYIHICGIYKITYSGRTENIPLVNHVLNVIFRKKLVKQSIEWLKNPMRNDLDPEVADWLTQCRPYPGLLQMLRVKLGVLDSFVQQGATASRCVEEMTDEKIMSLHTLKRAQATVSQSTAELSLFSLPSFLMTSVLRLLDEVVRNYCGPIGLPSIRVSDYLILYQFFTNQSASNWLLFLETPFLGYLSILTGLSITKIADFFKEEEIPINRTNSDEFFVRQGAFDSANPLDWLQRAKSSPMWQKISGLVYMSIATRFMKSSDVGQSVGEFIRVIGDFFGEGIDVVLSWNETVAYIFKRVCVAIEKQDIMELFEPDPISAALREIEEQLNRLRTKSFRGDPREALFNSQVVMTKYARNSNNHIMKKFSELEAARTQFASNLKCTRQKPLGLILTGQPGVGKTMAMAKVEAVFKRLNNIPQEIGVMHSVTDTNFQILPSAVHILLDNDTFSMKDELYQSTKGTTYINLWQTYVDTTTLRLDGASLADKSNSAVEPAIVAGTTNSSKIEITTSMNGHNKLDRRIFITHVTLKEKYIEKFRDEEAAYRHFARNYEKQHVRYTVGYMENTDTGSFLDFTIKEVLHVFEDLDQWVAWVIKQQRIINAQGFPDLTGECNGCFLSKRWCVCLVPSLVTEDCPVSMSTCKTCGWLSASCLCDKCNRCDTRLCSCTSTGVSVNDTFVQQGAIMAKVRDTLPMRLLSTNAVIRCQAEQQLCLYYAPWLEKYDRMVDFCMGYKPRVDPYLPEHLPECSHCGINLFECGCQVNCFLRQGAAMSVNLGEKTFNRAEETGVNLVNQLENAAERVSSTMAQGLTGEQGFVEKGKKALFDVMDKLKHTLDEKMSELDIQVKQTLITLAFGTISLSAVIAIWATCRNNGMIPQGATVTHLLNVPKLPDTSVINYGEIRPWLGASVLNDEALITQKEKPTNWMYGSFVLNNCFMAPRHLLENTFQGDVFEIKYAGMTFEYQVSEGSYFFPSELKDVVFLYLPQAKSVCKPFFQKLCDDISMPTTPVFFKGLQGKDVIWNGMGYSIGGLESEFGDCGRLLTGSDGKVFGFLIGKFTNTQQRVFVNVNKKDVNKAIEFFAEQGLTIGAFVDEFPPIVDKFVRQGNPGMHPRSSACMMDLWEKSIVTAGHVPIAFQTSKEKVHSKVKETAFRQFFPECPEMSSPFGGKHVQVEGKWEGPVLKRLRGSSNSRVNHKHMMNAIEGCLSDQTTIAKLQPISLYTAVCGSEHNVLVNARDNSKSIGPTAKDVHKLNNDTAFKQFPDGFVMDEKLIKDVESWLDSAYGRKDMQRSYVKACRKSESKEKVKAEKGDCRLFYINDVSFSLAFRQLVQPLIGHIMQFPDESSCYGTVNAGSKEWGRIKKLLDRVNTWWLTSDQKGFDIHHGAMMHYYATFMRKLALKNGYTVEQAEAVGRIIMMANIHFLEMFKELFYVDTTLTSGRPDTLVCNSIIQKICVYYFLSLKSELIDGLVRNKSGKMDIPRNSLAMTNTGDDNNTAISSHLNFDVHDIEKGYQDLGYEVTNADKSPLPLKVTKSDDAEYLKRGFKTYVLDDVEVVFAPLNIKSILKSLCYSVDLAVGTEAIKDRNAALCCINEMFMHGQDKFEEFRARLVRTNLCNFPLPTWEDLKRKYLLGVFTTWEVSDSGGDIQILKPFDSYATELGFVRQSAAGMMPNLKPIDWKASSIFPITEQQILNPMAPTEVQLTDVVTHLNTEVNEQTSTFGRVDIPRGKLDRTGLKDFFERPRRVNTLATGTPLNFGVYNIWSAIPGVSKVLGQQYYWFRGDMKVKFEFTGSSSCMGQYILYAKPRPQISKYNPNPLNISITAAESTTYFSTVTQLPHVLVDVSQVGIYELDLKWTSQWKFENAAQHTDWILTWAPLNDVKSVGGVSAPILTGDLFISFTNVEVDVLIPQGANGGEAPGMVSSILDYGARISSTLPFSWANPLTKGLEFGSSVARFFGFSRPQSVALTAMVQKNNAELAYGSGQPQFASGLTIDPCVYRTVAKNNLPLATTDDTTFNSLKSRTTMIVRNWNVLDSIMCDPAVENFSGVWLIPTSLSFVVKMFKYWTGDLEYCLQIISSPLVRWRIGVVIIPPGIVAPATFPSGGDYLTFVIDSVGTTCHDFTVPYLFKESFQPVFPRLLTSPDVGTTRLKYFSLATPTGPPGTTVTPELNLWVKGASNLSVGYPSLETMYGASFVPQGGQGLGVQSEMIFGEIIDDLVLLTRRACRIATTSTDALEVRPIQPVIPQVLSDDQLCFMTYLASAYYAESGGWIYSVEYGGDLTCTVFEGITPTGGTRVGSEGLAFMSSSEGTLKQIRFPDRNISLFRSPNFVGTALTAARMNMTKEGSSDINVQLYLASADDWVCGGFVCAPRYRFI